MNCGTSSLPFVETNLNLFENSVYKLYWPPFRDSVHALNTVFLAVSTRISLNITSKLFQWVSRIEELRLYHPYSLTKVTTPYEIRTAMGPFPCIPTRVPNTYTFFKTIHCMQPLSYDMYMCSFILSQKVHLILLVFRFECR